jgi:hypothetical protein
MPAIRILGLAIVKSFSKLFGLATITFFGRVPSRDDDKVGLIGLLSLIWLVAIAAIAVPALGQLAFPFLHDENMIRGLSTALVVGIGPLIGFIVTRMHNRHEQGRQVTRELVFGYGYAAIIGSLIVALLLVVPVVKASYIVRRFDLKHLAVMIARGDYEDVLEQLREALARHGLETEVERPQWIIYRLFTALAWMEGHIFCRKVAGDMLMLVGHTPDGDRFEITLHATDISVLGSKEATSLVMAILSEDLDERHLYFSWDDASQELEDRVRTLRRRLEEDGEPPAEEEITELCDRLRTMALESEEWNAIRRQLYKLECACLRARSGAATR